LELGKKALSFYQLLNKSDEFEWTAEAQASFEDLKRRLPTSPILVNPNERERMLLYITATNQVVSTALVIKRAEEGKVHGYNSPSSCRPSPSKL
jgi:hypothetical protein